MVFNCRLYLVTSPSQLTFKPESSPYFLLVSEGGTYPFPEAQHLRWSFGTPVFLVISNHYCHSPVSVWPSTSQDSCSLHRLSIFFFFSVFLLSLLPKKLASFSFKLWHSISRYNIYRWKYLPLLRGTKVFTKVNFFVKILLTFARGKIGKTIASL